MDARRPDDFGGLPPTQAWRVDAVCQRFEAAWRSGLEPRIEDFLAEADPPQRVALFRELLALEWELRQGRGERLEPRAYRTRFPDHTAVIEAVFGPETAGSSGGGSTPTEVPAPRPRTEVPGLRIGPYKLLHQIGEGGMGVVYLAEQESPVQRRVALKIIKPGLDSGHVIARFEAERQALALMDHPHIAKVLDAGTTDTGRPYFVMELVQGVPITESCDRDHLTLRERLELFVSVCQAIQHAHQKGIIHRDIKPSNVLVTRYDGRPVPKVIDFGVAKAIDQRLTERTIFTQFGQVIGTLEYMSPEQAELGALDIDTRSDIYSLGVVLYELLTGSTPLPRAELRQAAYAEILRRIREEETPKPSTRLGQSGDALATISAQRKTEPARLAKLVRGELDWIVMRALEKDRTRRYETADGLARDIQRHLDGDPVEAGPPSAAYRLRKFARKHRAVLLIAGAFAGLMLLAAAISTHLAIQATRAQRQALADRNRARDAEQTARAEADKAQAVNDFLAQDLLTQAEPANTAAEDHVSLLEVLDRAAAKVGDRFSGQPEVEDALRRTIAATYHGLASWEKAERQWRAVLESSRRRLGAGAAASLYAQAELAHILSHRGQLTESIPMVEEAADGLARALGPDHPATLASSNNLAEAYRAAGRTAEAIALHEATLKLTEAKLGPEHPDTLRTRTNLAAAYRAAGRIAEAIALNEATLKLMEAKLGPDHPDALRNRTILAEAYLAAGRTAEAIALNEATLRLMESKLGPDHLDTLRSRNDLATAYLTAGRTAEAIALHEATLQRREAKLGPDHPDTLGSRNNLAAAYRAAGRTAEAIALHEATLQLMETKLGPDHPSTLTSRNNLAETYQSAGRTAEAIALHEVTLKLRESKLGPDHPDTLQSRNNLAVAYLAAGRTAEAIVLHEATLRLLESKLGPDHPYTRASRGNLAMAYRAAGQLDRAVLLLEQALQGFRPEVGPDHPYPLATAQLLADTYATTGQHAKAELLSRQGLERARKQFGAADPRTAGAMAQLAMSLVQQRKWTEAEPVLRECLAIREKAQPDDWSTFNTCSLLGGSLLGQGRFAEAEPLVVSGYEGLKARAAKIPPPAKPRLTEAAERVVKLYEDWGKKDRAAEWRAKLAGPAGAPGPQP
jgi:serine/threonine protein kinase/uncharacterized protein YebE (UPF0316 family)